MCPAEEAKTVTAAKPKQRSRFSRQAIQDFKDNLPRSVVPVVLTILGTVGFQSITSVVHFASEQGQIRQQAHYDRQKDLELMHREVMIMEAVASFKFDKHLTLLYEFQRSVPNMNSRKREEFAAQLRDAIDETSGHLGTLEGFAGTESALPQHWLHAETEVLSAELDVLQTALGCAERPLATSAAKYDCLTSIRAHRSRFQRAEARSQSAGQTADADRKLFEAERELRWDRDSHNINMLFLKLFGALFGFALCFWAYAKLFSYFLETEKTESK